MGERGSFAGVSLDYDAICLPPSICLSYEPLSSKIESFMHNPKINRPQMVLKDFMEGKSKTRVIVNLRNPSAFSQTQNMKNMKVRHNLEKSINTAQERVIDALDPSQVHITNKFRYVFGFSAEVSLKGLQGLIDNPDVLSIENDEILHANLARVTLSLTERSASPSRGSTWGLPWPLFQFALSAQVMKSFLRMLHFPRG